MVSYTSAEFWIGIVDFWAIAAVFYSHLPMYRQIIGNFDGFRTEKLFPVLRTGRNSIFRLFSVSEEFSFPEKILRQENSFLHLCLLEHPRQT